MHEYRLGLCGQHCGSGRGEAESRHRITEWRCVAEHTDARAPRCFNAQHRGARVRTRSGAQPEHPASILVVVCVRHDEVCGESLRAPRLGHHDSSSER